MNKDKSIKDLKKYNDKLKNQIMLLEIRNYSLQYRLEEKDKENEKLKKIAHKMHLWIFLHSGDEQKVYDELGLTDEENAMLGYSGQFRIGEDKDE